MSFLGRFRTPFLSNSFNSVRLKSYTVAQLSTLTANVGDAAFCTDCLTPNGTGGPVYYDGSAWRLVASNIVATTDQLTWYVSAIGLKNSITTQIADLRVSVGYGQTPIVWNGTSTTGGGGAVGYASEAPPSQGNGYIFTGTTSNATAAARVYSTADARPYDYLSWFLYVDTCLTALSTAGTEFVAYLGASELLSVSSQKPATRCMLFVHDPNNGLGLGINNNNWWAWTMSATVSTGTVTDTGVAHTAATYQRLCIFHTPGSVKYYIDGALVVTHLSNTPTTGASYYPQIYIGRHTSTVTTSRLLNHRLIGYGSRWSTARII